MKKDNNFKEVILYDFNKEKNLIAINKKIQRNKLIRKGYIYSFAVVMILSFVVFNILSKKDINLDNNDYIFINTINEIIGIYDIDFRLEKISLSDLPLHYNILDNLNIDKENLVVYERYASGIIESNLYNELLGYEFVYDDINIFLSSSYETKPRNIELRNVEIKKSRINNLYVTIYKYGMEYIALFKINGIFYDINLKNDNQNKLIELIKEFNNI